MKRTDSKTIVTQFVQWVGITCVFMGLVLATSNSQEKKEGEGGGEATPKQPEIRPKKGREVVQAKVVEMKQRGKQYVLVADLGEKGGKQEFPMNRVKLEITGTGDADFLKPGVFVVAKTFENLGALIGDEFTVYPDTKNKPLSGIEKLPPKAGERLTAQLVAGTISSKGKDKDFTERDVMVVRAGGPVKMFLGQTYSIKVVLVSPEHLKPDQSIELEVSQKSKKYTLHRATVAMAEPMKGVDYLKEEEPAKKDANKKLPAGKTGKDAKPSEEEETTAADDSDEESDEKSNEEKPKSTDSKSSPKIVPKGK